MRLMSADYRQEEGSKSCCSENQLGGMNPLPRTGGVPTRASVIIEYMASLCQVHEYGLSTNMAYISNQFQVFASEPDRNHLI